MKYFQGVGSFSAGEAKTAVCVRAGVTLRSRRPPRGTTALRRDGPLRLGSSGRQACPCCHWLCLGVIKGER